MAPRVSGTSKLKKKNLPKIDPTIYSTIPLNELVVFSIHYLQEKEIAITVEELVSICFRLFPQSFSLKNYPRWPDSALVIRRLNDAREKGFVKGNPHDGFALKYLGQKLAGRTAKVLGLIKPEKKKLATSKPIKKTVKAVVKETKLKAQPQIIVTKKAIEQKPVAPKKAIKQAVVQSPAKLKPVEVSRQKVRSQAVDSKQVVKKKRAQAPITQKQHVKTPTPALTKLQAIQPEMNIPAKSAAVSKEEKVKAERIVRAMEKSDAYKLFNSNGSRAKISEFDFRNLLFATMESTPETLARNVNLFKGSAAIHNRQDLIKFLDYCETNFAGLLKSSAKKIVKKK